MNAPSSRSINKNVANKTIKLKYVLFICIVYVCLTVLFMYMDVIVKKLDLNYNIERTESSGADEENDKTVKTDSLKIGKYSSHKCIYSDDDNIQLMNNGEAICHFKDICYNYMTSNFEYYLNEFNTAPIFVTRANKIKSSFNEFDTFLTIKEFVPQIIHTINHCFESNKNITYITCINHNVILYEFNQENQNPGHELMDFFYPIYVILKLFNVNHENTQLLMLTAARRYDKYRNAFSKYLFPTYSNPIIIENKKPHNDLNYLCFPDLLISSNKIYSEHYVNFKIKPVYFNEFINNIFLKQISLNDTNLMHNKQSLLIINKSLAYNKTMHSGRKWYYDNDDSLKLISNDIQDIFKIKVNVIREIDLISMTFEEQIRYLHKYNVLISPSGTMAVLSFPFMKDGTSLITTDWFYPNQNSSVHLES
eukprot:536918_1